MSSKFALMHEQSCVAASVWKKSLVHSNTKIISWLAYFQPSKEKRFYSTSVFSGWLKEVSFVGSIIVKRFICFWHVFSQGAIFFQRGYHMKAVCQISVANAVLEVEFLIYKVGMEYASYNKNCLLTCGTTVKSDWKRWHILNIHF